MKPGIHPEYHEIEVIMTDGSKFTTRSTWGNKGDTIRLDIDPKSHPAWTGSYREVISGGQAAKFSKRFASFGSTVAGKTKAASEAEATKHPAKKAEEAPKEAKAEKAAAKKQKAK